MHTEPFKVTTTRIVEARSIQDALSTEQANNDAEPMMYRVLVETRTSYLIPARSESEARKKYRKSQRQIKGDIKVEDSSHALSVWRVLEGDDLLE